MKETKCETLLGQKIRDLRKQQKLSQTDIARELMCSRATISAIEHGIINMRRSPGALGHLAQLLSVNRDELATLVQPAPLRPPLPPRTPDSLGLFVFPEKQIENVHEWNRTRKWRLTDIDFAKLGPAPKWPDDHLTAVVLVPYLQTIHRTFKELWLVFEAIHSSSYDTLAYDNDCFDKRGGLRLQPGVEHKRRLKWEIIDFSPLSYPRETTVSSYHNRSENLPNAGVLAALAHFPKWVRRMNGSTIPPVILPGYQVKDDRVTEVLADKWRLVPVLFWVRMRRFHRGLWPCYNSNPCQNEFSHYPLTIPRWILGP